MSASLTIEVAGFHLRVSIGRDGTPDILTGDSTLDSTTELSDTDPDSRAQLDSRTPVGFQGSQVSGGRRHRSAVSRRFITPTMESR